ncbi:MAG: sigma-70 family RNA polymerase sigma factor [Sphingomicrobium sp.]
MEYSLTSMASSAGTLFPRGLASGMLDWMDAPTATPTPDRGRAELADLIRRTGTGERSALAAVYTRTSAKLYGVCMRVLGNETEAQDALQEVYVTVWRNAARFDSSRASPITWLCVVARNKCIDRLRQRSIVTDGVDAAANVADDSASAFEVLEKDQERGRLTGCLEELEERARTMIRAAFFDGQSYSQLAERESLPLSTMKSVIRRGLLRLRGCLEQ